VIVNLTPHPITIYPLATPDRIKAGSVVPAHLIEPSSQHRPARLGQQVLATDEPPLDGIPVDQVRFGTDPGCASTLPAPAAGTWYVVALVVALAAGHRRDLLVVHDYVRDLDGHMIGSRKLGRPVHHTD